MNDDEAKAGAAPAPRPLGAAEAGRLVRSSLLLGMPQARRVRGDGLTALVPAGSSGLPTGPVVCAIGSFDGFHVGHRALVASAMADARSRSLPLVVVTFAPDPSEVLSTSSPRRLLRTDDRLRALCQMGVAAVVAFDFTPELAALPYGRFVRERLLPVVAARRVHVGSDFALGAARTGTVGALAELGRELGFEVVPHELVVAQGAPVSATRIRDLLARGDATGAARLLGRWHFLRGEVRHGRGEGTGMGFPTANVWLSARDALPARGVYAGFVTAGDTAWPAAVNMGEPPTFTSADDAMLEANLLGFEGDLYGSHVAVSLVRRLRGERSFASVDELRATVLANIDSVRASLGGAGVALGRELP